MGIVWTTVFVLGIFVTTVEICIALRDSGTSSDEEK